MFCEKVIDCNRSIDFDNAWSLRWLAGLVKESCIKARSVTMNINIMFINE